MDAGQPAIAKMDDEEARRMKRARMKERNVTEAGTGLGKALDSSLKRHTALIKRIRHSLGTENHELIKKDIESLSLEKYVDEMSGAVLEGIARCKTEKDIWSAVEIISSLHRRFPTTFTPGLVATLLSALVPPPKGSLIGMAPEQREKEDATRIARQRPILRVCAELALVGIIRDAPGRSGGEWMIRVVKDLLSNDPTLSSLPLLSTFLKSYSFPYLGIAPPSNTKQVASSTEVGTLSEVTTKDANGAFPPLSKEEDELVEKEIRDRFKKMCEGYFDNVSKKLVIEHNRLQEQDRRNHEAYIRSGEIFEDRQQAYEKMTKGYEKLLASCQTLSELLYLPMPSLKTASQKSESIQIGSNTNSLLDGDGDSDDAIRGGKWEDEEEKRFFENIPDLKDYVPKGVLGLEEGQSDTDAAEDKDERDRKEENEKNEKARAEEEVRKLEEELANLEAAEESKEEANIVDRADVLSPDSEGRTADLPPEDDDDVPTPMAGTPKSSSPLLVPQGPSQLLTALLARLPDATNRVLIDQAAVEFAFLNSKAARKRLVKFMSQTPKNRIDLLPHYSRLVAILERYLPDVGSELVSVLDEEFRYLQRKKNVVKELAEMRLKNITFLSNLTKFRVVPAHVILHMFKVCLDDFSVTNVENIALLLEGCGRFLLRSEDTQQPFSKMVELMRRKQSMRHLDQRQVLLLENAYYQCNPPERTARQAKERTPMELFIRHLICDVLTKKTIDKVLKLIRKLDWNDAAVQHNLQKYFTKPWKVKYGSIPLLAMLTYDLQRYYPAFTIGIVDQVLEDIRRGLEQNVYSINQRRLASIKYLGELYIYRLVNSAIIFDTLWSIVTFGHPEGRPLPNQACPIDMPDDFFRIRLVCVLLDTCGMCFDRGSQQKRLDNFLTFFQLYILCKQPLPMDVDFMLTDSMEALRPKLVVAKTFEEAAIAVDELFNSALQNAGLISGDDSGDDSGDEGERREGNNEDDGDAAASDSPIDERAPSPEAVLLKNSQESLGPTDDDDADFAKELAKMVTETSSEARKVDKKTAQALWESTVPPPGIRKKRVDEHDDETDTAALSGEDGQGVMNFTLFTKRGNKQMTRQLAIPAESALAVQTKTAQMQDKVEQQHLKRLVLNYEQREEAEEMKAFDARNRAGAIKIRYVG